MTARRALLGLAFVVPLVVLALVRGFPELDAEWENHPAHFWLVLSGAAASVALGYAVFRAARARGDARLLLVSLAFVSAAGFIGLHALATPGVLLETSNPGFLLASPVGLVVAGVFLSLSPRERSREASARLLARSRLLLGALLGVIAVWAVLSVADLPPLDGALLETEAEDDLFFLAAVGLVFYGLAAIGYARLYARRRRLLVLGVTAATLLLAEAMVVIAFAENWRVSWWEWHVLAVLGFASVAYAAWREWPAERFAALYLEETLVAPEELTLLFADLQGYTSYTERNDPKDVTAMLNAYFGPLVAVLEERHGARVHELIGDEIMAVFQGDDHAVRGAAAGLALQLEASAVAAQHPDWPRFRVGVNSGVVATGVVGGERGPRKHGVVGDAVNLAARLQSAAPVGEVLVGEETYRRLPDGTLVEPLQELRVKGKQEPVGAYVLRSLP
jgi:class 3 adenylate cyclase